MTRHTSTTSAARAQASPQIDASPPLYYIYGRHLSQRRFRPMDLNKGTRVVNLIYASRLTGEQANRFFEVEAPRNSEWTFERRRIPTPCSLRRSATTKVHA